MTRSEWLGSHLLMAGASALIYLAALVTNEAVFPHLDFITGVNWIYLPAGMRLLCTLLFAESGALGVMVASWVACFYYYFPGDVMRAASGGFISALSCYLSYRFISSRYGLRASLRELTGRRLLQGVLLYAVASPLLHHLWFFLIRDPQASLSSLVVMMVGDLLGSLIVLYGFRLVIQVVKRARTGSRYS